MAAKRYGTKCRSHDSSENCGWNRTAEVFVYLGEKSREGSCVIPSKCPPRSADSEEGSDQARGEGEEDDEQESKGRPRTSCGLGIDFSQRKRTIAVQDGIEVGDPIE